MAKHGGSRHLKKRAVSFAVPVQRKGFVWFKKPAPGRHLKKECIPLIALLRDLLGLVKDAREGRALLSQGKVFVDGRQVRKEGFPTGLMDVVSIPEANLFYRIMFSKNKLMLSPISKEDASWKYCKIKGKRTAKKNKVQLSLHDGRTLVGGEELKKLKPSDSLKISIPAQEVKKILRQEKNCLCYIYKGTHSGEIARLIEVLPGRSGQPRNALLESLQGKRIVTLQDYLFVVDEDFKLGEEKRLKVED